MHRYFAVLATIIAVSGCAHRRNTCQFASQPYYGEPTVREYTVGYSPDNVIQEFRTAAAAAVDCGPTQSPPVMLSAPLMAPAVVKPVYETSGQEKPTGIPQMVEYSGRFKAKGIPDIKGINIAKLADAIERAIHSMHLTIDPSSKRTSGDQVSIQAKQSEPGKTTIVHTIVAKVHLGNDPDISLSIALKAYPATGTQIELNPEAAKDVYTSIQSALIEHGP